MMTFFTYLARTTLPDLPQSSIDIDFFCCHRHKSVRAIYHMNNGDIVVTNFDEDGDVNDNAV